MVAQNLGGEAGGSIVIAEIDLIDQGFGQQFTVRRNARDDGGRAAAQQLVDGVAERFDEVTERQRHAAETVVFGQQIDGNPGVKDEMIA